MFKASLNSFSLSLCTSADDCGMSHSSDNIPVPHHCAFFWFSCPLNIFSELSCKTNAISSLIFERCFSEVSFAVQVGNRLLLSTGSAEESWEEEKHITWLSH